MGIEIGVDFEGIRRLASEVRDMRARSKDLGPVLRPQAELLRTVIDDSWTTQTGPNGEPWEPLSPLTRPDESDRTPVLDNGFIRGRIESRVEGGTTIVFGVAGEAAEYAPYHQFGTEDIPARPFLPMDEDERPMFVFGRARKWAERTAKRTMRYLLRGR